MSGHFCLHIVMLLWLLIPNCHRYLSKLSVYDRSEQAVFVILGAAGEELTGRKASELVESYYQVVRPL